jgi:anti-anti-sigma regulatory factor
MNISYADDNGWLIVTLEGNATNTGRDEFRSFREEFPWDRSVKVVVDVEALEGASDAAVEALMGLTADAHHRGGRVVVIGESAELRARISALGMEGYVRTAMSVAHARMTLDMRNG